MKKILFINGLILFCFASFAHASLINNGTFDTDFDGWKSRGQVNWKPGKGGHIALSKQGQENINGKIRQAFALDEEWAGLNISFDFKFKDWSPNGKDVLKAMLKIRTVDQGIMVLNLLKTSGNDKKGWNHVAEYVDLTEINPDYSRAKEAVIIFKLRDRNKQSDAYARIDNIAINAVPEPETIALLAIGLAGMTLARKKKV